jgi:hypothetical protein
MSQLLTNHQGSPLNNAIMIMPVGQPTAGGAFAEYQLFLIPRPDSDDTQAMQKLVIQFHNGPITSPDDFNGFTNEALLAVVEHRLEKFAEGQFGDDDTKLAREHVSQALYALLHRTKKRLDRGVEGQHQK